MISIENLYTNFLQCTGVTTDTRKINPGELFFALRGANFNGNTYALHALEMGALYAVCDEDVSNDPRILRVDNVLHALQQLAFYHRNQFAIPVIALTGSNGKTTTKELMHAVLSKKYNTIATIGNLNNHIGVPLTLLRIRKETEMAIIEMGANHQREIASYCTYTHPTHGLITNIGKAHLEGFGGEEGVLKGKTELFDYLQQHQGQIFAYSGDEKLYSKTKSMKDVLYYGSENSLPNLYISGTASTNTNTLCVVFKNHNIKTQLAGIYNFPNLMAALCVGAFFNVPEIDMVQALEAYTPDNNRSQFQKIGSNIWIMDAYNANPSSMSLAIENIVKMSAMNKMMILGEMKELGEYSEYEHRIITQQCENSGIRQIILIGNAFITVKNSDTHIRYFATTDEAHAWFKTANIENTTILLKGSRSMSLEKIVSN